MTDSTPDQQAEAMVPVVAMAPCPMMLGGAERDAGWIGEVPVSEARRASEGAYAIILPAMPRLKPLAELPHPQPGEAFATYFQREVVGHSWIQELLAAGCKLPHPWPSRFWVDPGPEWESFLLNLRHAVRLWVAGDNHAPTEAARITRILNPPAEPEWPHQPSYTRWDTERRERRASDQRWYQREFRDQLIRVAVSAVQAPLFAALLSGEWHAVGFHSEDPMKVAQAVPQSVWNDRSLAFIYGPENAFLRDRERRQWTITRTYPTAAVTFEAGEQIGRGKGGKPVEYDRLTIMRRLVRIANTPDGLPSDAAGFREVVRRICEIEWGKEPSPSTLALIIKDVSP